MKLTERVTDYFDRRRDPLALNQIKAAIHTKLAADQPIWDDLNTLYRKVGYLPDADMAAKHISDVLIKEPKMFEADGAPWMQVVTPLYYQYIPTHTHELLMETGKNLIIQAGKPRISSRDHSRRLHLLGRFLTKTALNYPDARYPDQTSGETRLATCLAASANVTNFLGSAKEELDRLGLSALSAQHELLTTVNKVIASTLSHAEVREGQNIGILRAISSGIEVSRFKDALFASLHECKRRYGDDLPLGGLHVSTLHHLVAQYRQDLGISRKFFMRLPNSTRSQGNLRILSGESLDDANKAIFIRPKQYFIDFPQWDEAKVVTVGVIGDSVYIVYSHRYPFKPDSAERLDLADGSVDNVPLDDLPFHIPTHEAGWTSRDILDKYEGVNIVNTKIRKITGEGGESYNLLVLYNYPGYEDVQRYSLYFDTEEDAQLFLEQQVLARNI